jgi:hypothetical protein
VFTVTDDLAAPIPCNLFGTEYLLPRFLFPEFSEWAGIRQEQMFEEYAGHLNDKERAVFRQQYPPRRPTLAELIDDLQTEVGVDYVLRKCMKAGGVAQDVIDKAMKLGDPERMQLLADNLTCARQAQQQVTSRSKTADERDSEQDGEPVDPKSGSGSTTGDSPGTGEKIDDGSSSSTATSSSAD